MTEPQTVTRYAVIHASDDFADAAKTYNRFYTLDNARLYARLERRRQSLREAAYYGEENHWLIVRLDITMWEVDQA